MGEGFIIFVLTFTVARPVLGLTCNDCVAVGSTGSCSNPSTCDSGTNPCQTSKTISSLGDNTVFSCSSSDECIPTAMNMTSMFTATTCCDTDLCNDGTVPTLEENLAYCYSAFCNAEGCLSGMREYIDSNNLGTFCPASEEGCQTTITTTADGNGGRTYMESTGCATAPCTPTYQITGDTEMKMACCKDRLCNNGGELEADPNKEYCYSFTCVGSSCPSVADAASEGKVGLCEKSEKGCYHTTVMAGADGTTVSSGCVGPSSNVPTCIASQVNTGGIQTTTKCCNGDRCNNGRDQAEDPNKSYCNVYNCISETCPTMAEAVEQGLTVLCEQTSDGCFTSRIVSSNSTIFVSGCVGVTPGSTAPCIPTSVSFGDTQTSVTCCSTNKCNGGTRPYCHVYTCSSPSCPSLTKAINDGQTTKCDKKNKGCYAMKNSTHVIAGCIGESYGVSECPEKAECCQTDGCNSDVTSASELITGSRLLSILLCILFCLKYHI